MSKNRLTTLVLSICLLAACAPSAQTIQTAIAQTQAAWTPIPTSTAYPTQTAYPTLTPQPTIVVTRVVVSTPVPNNTSGFCKPLTNMDYSDNSKIMVQLQAYVSTYPFVKSISYVIPEKIYSTTQSQIIFVTYTGTDGGYYAQRFIVYVNENYWKPGTFSINGQCWIDPPK